MALDTVRRADHKHRTVQHLKHAFHLRRKIHMSRRVKERHLHIPPPKHRLLGKDRDAALTLQFICIEERIPVVHPPHTAEFAAQIEHPL